MKLPPYARAIVAERDAGRHPVAIMITIAEKWQRPSHPYCPAVFVPEADYLAGGFTFYWCAGVPVELDTLGTAQDASWLHLAGELGAITAPVMITAAEYATQVAVPRVMDDLRGGSLFRGDFPCALSPDGGYWPPFWSDKREAAYHAHLAAYHRAHTFTGAIA